MAFAQGIVWRLANSKGELKMYKIFILTALLSFACNVSAQTWNDAIDKGGQNLASVLMQKANKDKKNPNISISRFRSGGQAGVYCEPLSSQLTDRFRSALTKFRNQFSLPFTVVREDDPNKVDIIVIGKWQSAAKGKIALAIDVGDVKNNLFPDLGIENLTFDLASLPENAQKCIFDIDPVLSWHETKEKVFIYASPDPLSKEIGSIPKDKKLWILARVRGTEWNIVKVKDKDLPAWKQLGFAYRLSEKKKLIPKKAEKKPPKPNRLANERVQIKPLSFSINYVYRDRGIGPLKPIKQNSVLHSRDHYKIIFTPGERSYTYIFQADSTGQIFQLFPWEDLGNPVIKGGTYVLPSDSKAFQLDDQTGTERFYFVVSRNKNEELEELYDAVKRSRSNRSKSASFDDTHEKLNKYFIKRRGMGGTVADSSTKTVNWKETGEIFSVIGQRLETACEGCVHVLKFQHR